MTTEPMTKRKTIIPDRRASIGTTAALLLPVLIGMTGGGVDLARSLLLRSQAQDAADQAVLELARYLQWNKLTSVPPATRDKVASSIFTAKLGADVTSTFDVSSRSDRTSNSTTLTAKSTVPTVFLQAIGVPSFEIEVRSTAKYDVQTYAVEIAFVMNTGASMNTGRKKKALDDAMRAVLDKFEAANKNSRNRVRVAVVPFQLGVSVPAVDSKNFSYGFSASPPSQCVTDRVVPYAYTNLLVQLLNPLTQYPLADAADAPNYCNAAPLVPITTDIASVRAALPTAGTVSGTNGAIGLVWGWNMLTPGAPNSTSGTIPLSKDQTHLQRVLIYMTDGENTANAKGTPATIVDDWSLLACTSMKLSGISVVTINIDGSGSEAFLKACASSPSKYKKVPAPDLPAILDEVSEDVTGYTPIRLVE